MTGIDREQWLLMYEQMYRIRTFEEQVNELYLGAKMPGLAHLYIGEEAIAVGVCEALKREDYITSTHRGHGHCIAKGTDLRAMMAELMGKAAGTNRGRGGSMHIADPALGILGANGIVGGGVPIAVGAAWAARTRGSGQVVACFYGDGAANEGGVHEAMNIASLWKLPVVFVCENNRYAEMTPQRVHGSVEDLARRAAGYDMPGVTVDGNDVLAVLAAAEEAAARARRGDGPTLLECKTFRVRGHFEGDPQRYKPADEAAEWKERDPLTRLRAYLAAPGRPGAVALDAIDGEVEDAIRRAVAFADAAPLPDPAEVAMHVYAQA